MNTIIFFYGYIVFFYSMALIVNYLLMIFGSWRMLRSTKKIMIRRFERKIVNISPMTPGVSIIAPAYNEENTIVENVHSLLNMDYPKFELVIVNDGSKDKTLENLIEAYQLVEVPYDYQEHIKTKAFRRCLMSTNPEYHNLIVVDKENGGTKADASNAGINVAHYPYFICTDSDCILDKDAIFNCINAVMQNRDVIAVSGNMNMVNGCEVEDGKVKVAKPSWNPIPMIQSLEYLRSFLIGKMGMSYINALPNVSGGFGLFDKEVAIAAGGYRADSFAEDNDIILRMVAYACDAGIPYRIVQVPEICCWTEAPYTPRLLYRQRVRWGRGLIQTLSIYRQMIFNRKYRVHGLVTLPYQVIFEFLAPIIEAVGFLVFLWLAFTGGVNWDTAWVITLAILMFGFTLGFITIYYDFNYSRMYPKKRSYFWLALGAILEPFCYHPFLVVFALIGYWKYLTNQKAVWGEMVRRGFKGSKKNAAKPAMA